MAARVLRVQLAGPRGILAARAPAAERVVGADDSERKRSGFRAPRREMRPSRQTASRVGRALFYRAQRYLLCPGLTRPGQQRLSRMVANSRNIH
jgi:hypothetical protein